MSGDWTDGEDYEFDDNEAEAFTAEYFSSPDDNTDFEGSREWTRQRLRSPTRALALASKKKQQEQGEKTPQPLEMRTSFIGQ